MHVAFSSSHGCHSWPDRRRQRACRGERGRPPGMPYNPMSCRSVSGGCWSGPSCGRRSCSCVPTEGGLLDLRCRRAGEDDPVRGQAWRANQRVRAQVLFQLLTGYGPQLADPVVAVRLRGAHVVGRLNVGGSTLSCALELKPVSLGSPVGLGQSEDPESQPARQLPAFPPIRTTVTSCSHTGPFQPIPLSGSGISRGPHRRPA
jgi:hypothetical protein